MVGNLWTSPVGDVVVQQAPFNTQNDTIHIDALANGGAVLAWSPAINSDYETFVTLIGSDGAQTLAPFEASDGWDFSNGLHHVTGLSDGSFLVTFNTRDPSYWGVAVRDFTTAGASVHQQRINTFTNEDQTDGKTAELTGGGTVTVWSSEDQDAIEINSIGVFGQLLNASGDRVGMEFQVNTTSAGQQNDAEVVGLLDGGFAVVWNQGGELYFQRFDAAANKVGGEVHLTSDTAYDSNYGRIDRLTDGNIVLTWSEKESAAHDSGDGIFARILDETGAAVTPIIKVDPDYDVVGPEGNQLNQAVTALADGGFMVSWEDERVDGVADNYGILARRFDKTGAPIGDQFVVDLGGQTSVGYSGDAAAPLTQTADGTVIFAWLDTTDFATTGGTRQLNTRSFELASYIVGTSGDDWMDTGTSGNDTMLGLDGRDWLFGYEGDDSLDGGPGGGELMGGPGNDTMRGGDGIDAVFIDDLIGNVTVERGAGGLQITSAEGVDFVFDNVEEFFFLPEGENNVIRTYAQMYDLGVPQQDIAVTGYLFDFVDRPDGTARAGDVITVDVNLANPGSAAMPAGAQLGVYLSTDDTIENTDTELGLFDLAGIAAGGTLDVSHDVTLPSGLSDGTYYIGVLADPAGAVMEADETNNALFSVPLTLSSVPTVSGTAAAENVDGTAASEVIYAEGGSDWITPGGGNDTVWGGHGNDMVSFINLPDTPGRTNVDYRMTIDLGAGTAHNHDNSEQVILHSIERVTGTIFADYIRGDAGANQLRGAGDYDWFIATTGPDTIDGGTGQDMISFVEWQNAAANVIGDPFGALPPTGAQATGIYLDLSNPANNTNLAVGLDLTSVERITGSGRQDVFFGDDAENDFRGLGDFDWFVSSDGGRERYFGGDGVDTVTYYNAPGAITASLRNGALVNGEETGYGTQGWAARDLYFEIENLVGSNYGDSLTGNSGRNQINGLAGDDIIFGYGGIDYLKGGLGNDTINGGGSSDYALFDGNRGDYTLTKTSSSTVTVSGADGTDSLIDVEYMVFDDGQVTIWELPLA